jgi:hypothetical protein
VNKFHEWAAGAALASIIGVGGCGERSPVLRPAAAGHSPAVSALADAEAAMDATRKNAFGTPSATTGATEHPAARMDTDTHCESEPGYPRFSCHRYRPTILAMR